jgi:hypothetical protein
MIEASHESAVETRRPRDTWQVFTAEFVVLDFKPYSFNTPQIVSLNVFSEVWMANSILDLP